MDPNATMRRLRDALQTGDRDEALEALGDLLDWLKKGGLLPEWPADAD
jgi:hypothetical protein